MHDDRFAWAALGCFEAHVCEDGGSNRSRQQIFGGLIVFGTLGSFVGTLAASLLLTGILVTFCWLFACSMSTQLGRSFAACSTPAIVLYLCALGYPSPAISVAFERAVFTGAGILWAAFLTCFIWPMSFYGQLRGAIAACYRDLLSFLEELSVLSHGGDSSLTIWTDVVQQRTEAIRELLDHGRQILTATRLARRQETDLGYQLVYLLETADLALRLTTVFSESLRKQVERFGHYRRVLPAILWEALTIERQIADHLAPERHGRSRSPDGQSLTALSDEEQYGALHALVNLLQGAAKYSQAVADGDRRFSLFRAPDLEQTSVELAARERSDRWQAVLHSITDRTEDFHNALRLSTACCLDLLLVLVFPVRHSHWLTLTAVIVLQPAMSMRLRPSFQRLIAAVAGGSLAATVGATLKLPLALMTFTLLSIVAACAFPFNPYSLVTLLLTPLLLLLPLDSVSDWGFAGTRVLNTLLGTFIASASMYLLWPVWEHRRFSGQVLVTLRRTRTYLQTLIEVLQLPGSKPLPSMAPYITEARRSAKLEVAELEAALQRLLVVCPNVEAEPLIALMGYLRQLTWTITTAHQDVPAIGNSSEGDAEVHQLKRLLRLFSNMENRVEGRSLPAPWERKYHRHSFRASFVNVNFLQLERQTLQLARIVSRSRWLWREDQGRDMAPGQTT